MLNTESTVFAALSTTPGRAAAGSDGTAGWPPRPPPPPALTTPNAVM